MPPTATGTSNLNTALDTTNQMGSYFVLVVVLLLVLLAAYLTTRFIGSRGRGLTRGKYLRVTENLFISKDKSVMLLEAGEDYYLVGVTNQSMQLLGTIPKAALPPLPDEGPSGIEGFRGVLSRMYNGAKTMASAPNDLRKAQAEAKATPAKEAEQAAPPQGGDVLPLRRSSQKKSDAPAKAAPTKKSAGGRGKAAAPDFAQSLQEANERALEGDEAPSVIVEISPEAEHAIPPGKGMGAALKRKEDEIDRMMQSIEQRTQQLKQRRGKGPDNEEG